jgi:hypothetical protein
MEKARPENNLLRDVRFSNVAADRGAKPWSLWQEATSKGTGSLANGVAKLTQTENGTIGQTISVKPGELYVIGAKVKQTGPGEAGILINWQENGKWAAQSQRVEFVPSDKADAEGWREISGLVRVPPAANMLGFLMFVRRQEGAGDEAVFKNPVVARVLE